MINRYVPLVSWLAAMILLIPADALAQCAMCGTAISSPDDPLARGLYWSVLFLGTMPFLIIGSIGGWLIYTYRRGPGRRQTTAPILRLVTGKARRLPLHLDQTPKENEN